MTAEETSAAIKTLKVVKEVQIAAPADIVFETILEPHGPMKDLSMKLEAWPGGRWFRDLGNDTGHLWGHVQVIKPPRLLEIWGPLMMSFPAINHLQYRLTAEGNVTRLQLTHKAIALAGLIPPDLRDGMGKGFDHWIKRIKQRAEAGGKAKSSR